MNLELLFRALADRTRLRLLNLMRDQEVCVCYFVEILRASQPKISRHLAYLRRAGIVSVRRSGTWMHYRITVPKDAAAVGILRGVLAALADDREMKNDLLRLEKACCTPARFARLQGAPMPMPATGDARQG
jgi:ArsR family transcriptional regulator